jgi:hypothetical protein
MVTIIKVVISTGAFLFIIFKIIGQVNSGQWHDMSSFRPGFLLLGSFWFRLIGYSNP